MLEAAINRAISSDYVFAKFLAPNDTGLTGGHQCGIYIHKQNVPLIFEKTFERGENKERSARIIWNEGAWDYVSNFKYYGQGTRDEYRITSFGRGFPFLKHDNTGDLIVICTSKSREQYYAYILSDDDSINSFLDTFSISPTELNSLVKHPEQDRLTEEGIIENYVMDFGDDFPSTRIMSVSAEEIDRIINGDPLDFTADETILRWVDTEYKLFRKVEEVHYSYVTLRPANSIDEYVQGGLEITNRRKARAGKSLEHHLASMLKLRGISFSAQAKTEGVKRPDFIFPSEAAYHDDSFPDDRLIFLGAKTTCKDRWRQIINEADRIPTKHLFTLQQGVSPNQLNEMHEAGVVLVVPEAYHCFYPKTDYKSVISLEEFITLVKTSQQR